MCVFLTIFFLIININVTRNQQIIKNTGDIYENKKRPKHKNKKIKNTKHCITV